MTDFVIDASVAIKGFIGEEYSDLAARVLENPVAAPDLLCPECANILWKKVTRDGITPRRGRDNYLCLVVVGDRALPHSELLDRGDKDSLPAQSSSLRLLLHGAGAGPLELPFVTADERLLRRVGASALTELKTLVQPLPDWA